MKYRGRFGQLSQIFHTQSAYSPVPLRQPNWIGLGYVRLRTLNSPAQIGCTSTSNCPLRIQLNIRLRTRTVLGQAVWG
jgi:hypothetical protein